MLKIAAWTSSMSPFINVKFLLTMIVSFYNFSFEYGTGVIAFDNLLMGGIIRCAAIHFVIIVFAIFIVLYIGTIVSDSFPRSIYLNLILANIRFSPLIEFIFSSIFAL